MIPIVDKYEPIKIPIVDPIKHQKNDKQIGVSFFIIQIKSGQRLRY